MTDEQSVTRTIAGIKNRTAQEVFDIMCDRFRLAHSQASGGEGMTLVQARRIVDAVTEHCRGADFSCDMKAATKSVLALATHPTQKAQTGIRVQIIGGPCDHRWAAMTMPGQMSCTNCRQTRPMTATEVAQWTK